MNSIDHDLARQRFSTHVDGLAAVLDYTLAGRLMTITHTGVPPAIGGRGIAAQLMRAALQAAHASGWTVMAACSYAAAYMRRHPQDAER